jgi:hypothetical protein
MRCMREARSPILQFGQFFDAPVSFAGRYQNLGKIMAWRIGRRGFDEEVTVAYNDVDLCLKMLEKG